MLPRKFGQAVRPLSRDCVAMRRASPDSPARPRSRSKIKGATPSAPVVESRNVGSIEALLSLTLGVLMVVAALVPRSFKQLFLLGLGGGLLHRGLTGECGFYKAVGVNTAGERTKVVAAKD